VGFLRQAVSFLARHGVTVERMLTDNDSAYRSAIHAIACRALGIKHLRTRPRRPQTNGTAERFIRTMLGGWPTAPSTAARPSELPRWRAGFGATTSGASTAPSAEGHRQLGSPS
jgi:transposase InsO family protein